VALEEVSNAAGRVINRCAYSTMDSRGAIAHYFLSPSEIAHPQTRSGAAFVRIVRDDNGFDCRLEYYDGTDRPQPDDLGSFGREIEVNAQGLETRATQLGRDLKPAMCKEGYGIAESTHDSSGNITSQSYFDADGAPALHKEGYHRAVLDLEPTGQLDRHAAV